MRTRVLVAIGLLLRAPLIALTAWALSTPLSLSRFRLWLVALCAGALALDVASVFLFARLLRCPRPRASVMFDGLRAQLGFVGVAGVGLWTLSAIAAGEGRPRPGDLEPLITYGWIAAAVIAIFGIASAASIAVRDAGLPGARVS